MNNFRKICRVAFAEKKNEFFGREEKKKKIGKGEQKFESFSCPTNELRDLILNKNLESSLQIFESFPLHSFLVN